MTKLQVKKFLKNTKAKRIELSDNYRLELSVQVNLSKDLLEDIKKEDIKEILSPIFVEAVKDKIKKL